MAQEQRAAWGTLYTAEGWMQVALLYAQHKQNIPLTAHSTQHTAQRWADVGCQCSKPKTVPAKKAPCPVQSWMCVGGLVVCWVGGGGGGGAGRVGVRGRVGGCRAQSGGIFT